MAIKLEFVSRIEPQCQQQLCATLQGGVITSYSQTVDPVAGPDVLETNPQTIEELGTVGDAIASYIDRYIPLPPGLPSTPMPPWATSSPSPRRIETFPAPPSIRSFPVKP